jgi:lysophospholipase L1-like esterase
MSSIIIAIAALIGALVVAEIAFRVWHRSVHGRDYFVALKFRWTESHVVAHPFLTFAYRKNGVIEQNQRLPYALWPNRYYSFKEPLRLNSIGHFGPELPIERSRGSLRIACLGSSGVANNIADQERDYCWPSMLQDRLASSPPIQRHFSSVEVMNCGIGGWTMIDVLIDFAVNTVHYRPDFVVMYQGLNDLPLHLMADYAFDYSHGRRNLGEVIHVIKRGYRFPKLRWWHSYEFVKDRLVGTGNVRNEVLGCIETCKPDYSRAYRPLVAEEAALRHLLILCRAYGIRVIIGSYVFHDHSGGPRNRKLYEGVRLENAMFRRLAEEFDVPFIDLDGTIAKDRDHFVDAVHFTPAGMEFVAERVADSIVEEIAQTRPLRSVGT